MQKENDNLIVKLSLEFALDIITYSQNLEEHRKYIVANQILKSGMSNGANLRKAQNAESRADFIHKMKIAAKEAGETDYWLTLCESSPSYPKHDNLKVKLDSILNIISKIIITSKANQ